MSRLSKWHAELKHLQKTLDTECAGIHVFDHVPAVLVHMPCHECEECVLQRDTFDKWFEDTFNKE